jgi:predicted ATPase/DNA-binding CsgD family transcriptional regulator
MSIWEVPSSPKQPLLVDRRRIFSRVPVPLTPLVGREQELALARSLLRRDDVRLLSITGPGGIGKTRLAVEIARSEVGAYPDGVAFIPLAAVSEPNQVAVAIRQALGEPENIGADARDSLVAVLRGLTALLVLDNFEHVLEAAPLLTDLLAVCDQLKIVATSRALLRLTGEYVLPVPPLVLPDPEASGSLENVNQSPSVRLFVDRIRATNPAFAVSEETAPLVVSICRHLDGLPLAIELAAAQAAVLPMPALLDRIQARLPLPVTGPRDAPARLRTINDAVAWSYDLLADDEKWLFRRIGVFAGGFALDAAESLTEAVDDLPLTRSISTLEGLFSLVEKNLLRWEDGEGDQRFSMLETIRSFAWDQLIAHGEADRIGDAHAAWVLELAERHALAVVMTDGEQILRRMEVDHANLIAALMWFERRGNNESLLRLAAALGGFWIAHNHYREGRDWLERALARTEHDSSAARGRAEISLGRSISQFGEIARADRLLTDGIARLDRERDAAWTAFALTRQASLANQLGEHDRAEYLLREALDVAMIVPDSSIAAAIIGTTLANLGVAAHGRGEIELAIDLHERALKVCLERGYTLGAIRSLRDLGDVERDRSDFDRSLAHYRGALDLLGEQADLRVVVDVLAGAALAAAVWRQPVQAARLQGAAERYRLQHGGEFLVPADRLAHERATDAIRAALSEPEIRAAWAEGQRLTVAEAIDEVQALSPSAETVKAVVSPAVHLTPRELEVLHLLVSGLPDRAIADSLFLSVRTVEAHVARILTKLEVRTRTAAVSAAIVAGLVDPETPATG